MPFSCGGHSNVALLLLLLLLQVTEELQAVQQADLIEGRLLLLAAGKKNKMLVRVE
jgi:hypothetical protein